MQPIAYHMVVFMAASIASGALIGWDAPTRRRALRTWYAANALAILAVAYQASTLMSVNR